MAGKIAPPKNSKNHKRAAMIIKLSKNGIGIAHARQNTPAKHVILAAYSELYPPSLVVTFPPTTTPKTGPVILITPKEINTISSGTLRVLIQ